MKSPWVKSHLLNAEGGVPCSFIFDDQPSEKFLAGLPRNLESQPLNPARTQHTLRWADPKTNLEVRCVAVEYADYPVVE
jgi:hypothetical protein